MDIIFDYLKVPISERSHLYFENRALLDDLLIQHNEDIPDDIMEHIDSVYLRDKFIRNNFPRFENSNISIWEGDITTLNIDAIVNAANSNMLGCFQANHKCIDNIIHRRAGPRLRMECRKKMKIGHDVNYPMITYGHFLPCKYIFHVVGPNLSEGNGSVRKPTKEDKLKLQNCYNNVLDLCIYNDIRSVAFYCISTGIFGYPSEEAASIAISTARRWTQVNNYGIYIVFNTFLKKDTNLYLDVFKNLQS